MEMAVKCGLEYLTDGTVLQGNLTQRQYAVAIAQVILWIDSDVELHLAVHPDVASYAFDDGTLEVLVPSISREWIRTPFAPNDDPLLAKACETDEIRIRVVAGESERVFHASNVWSPRWTLDNPAAWAPEPIRDRLLVQVGRDGAPNPHHAAAKVSKVHEPTIGEQVVILRDLVLPSRSTCIFCDSPNPETREHAVPAWANPPGANGITVASCGRCNNRLSRLEDEISRISRSDSVELTPDEQRLVAWWAIKTIWVLGKALNLDPLGDSGDAIVASLLGLTAEGLPAPSFEIDEIFASVEPSKSLNFLKYTTDESDRLWAMLRVLNIVTSVWITPL